MTNDARAIDTVLLNTMSRKENVIWISTGIKLLSCAGKSYKISPEVCLVPSFFLLPSRPSFHQIFKIWWRISSSGNTVTEYSNAW